MKRSLLIAVAIITAGYWTCPALGRMASEHYRITTTVISGGGTAMGSANFGMNSTLGQPSPLMNPADPPYSDVYDLYPGFWYTLDAEMVCGDLAAFAAAFGRVSGDPEYSPECDTEPDGDVDGVDLAEYAAGY